ncbi:hypothetical protein [Cupriavidus sp. a3]|uniref:hypothetical protein n=1 Tax=Cupriavidus sp. a3 TaxID=3242158 RepID=UPI003D9C4597
MKSFEWLLIESECDIDNDQLFSIAKEVFLKDTKLNNLIKIDHRKDFVAIIAAFRLARTSQARKGEHFISDKHELAFYITNHEAHHFDEALGITRKHYVDKVLAKEWRDKLAAKFHPDRDNESNFKENEEVTEIINRIYKRMVGKA